MTSSEQGALSVDLRPAGRDRLLIALLTLAVFAGLAWRTMEPGRFRSLTLVLLGFFGFRAILGYLRAR